MPASASVGGPVVGKRRAALQPPATYTLRSAVRVPKSHTTRTAPGVHTHRSRAASPSPILLRLAAAKAQPQLDRAAVGSSALRDKRTVDLQSGVEPIDDVALQVFDERGEPAIPFQEGFVALQDRLADAAHEHPGDVVDIA